MYVTCFCTLLRNDSVYKGQHCDTIARLIAQRTEVALSSIKADTMNQNIHGHHSRLELRSVREAGGILGGRVVAAERSVWDLVEFGLNLFVRLFGLVAANDKTVAIRVAVGVRVLRGLRGCIVSMV